ncbi:lipopolysaccharide transport periplasmic protein LptA [Pantoea sp. Aalb]|uniref:lipopolysaccharide transport periplasmic protein LptA n=1 Tax=Pantoea sp. Aalb TaxID=2576762 RepID=UPI0013245CCF|nr:lipopolysaccharide transport periplasmic protein LptA [Pantoea sp. Aalb]MXP67815.1 lipopolysaccharide transport periplasmic protein LptA [Pantoea sp. Aalb]
MKLTIRNNNIKALLAQILLVIHLPVLALTENSNKKINIHSVNQILDLQKNNAAFTGYVSIDKEKIKINADRIFIKRFDENNKLIINAYGKPVTFSQIQDKGKKKEIIQGHANKLRYEQSKDCVELSGNAFIQQQNSSIQADRITYLVKEQKMHAYSKNKNSRVTTTILLMSSKKQNKSNSINQKK